jgi:hypothetical protein
MLELVYLDLLYEFHYFTIAYVTDLLLDNNLIWFILV